MSEFSGKLDIAGVVRESITDGEGIRFVLFVQGCPHHCPGCHNPATHEFGVGTPTELGAVVREYKKNPLLRGITFSGGEPFCQAEGLACLAEEIKLLGGDVWTYTGYLLEDLLDMSSDTPSNIPNNIPNNMINNKGIRHLLDVTDVLVDGRFIAAEKSLTLRFRGSGNQRLIDLDKTRAGGYKKILTFE